jgi:hypothetical protein
LTWVSIPQGLVTPALQPLIQVNFPAARADNVKPSQTDRHNRRQPMFVDTVVLAGVGTVLLMVAFFGGVGYFIWKDAHKRKQS